MKLVHSPTGLCIDVIENQVNVIVIESPELLAEYVTEIKKQLNGDEGKFVLSDKEICKLEKMLEIIVDPWAIDFNSKKIKSKLLQVAKEESDEYCYEQFLEAKGVLCQYAENVMDKINYPVSYNMDMDSMALFKFLDIKIEIQSEKLIDTLIEYVKLLHDLCKIEVIVLVNIKTYLTEEEITYLYQEALYRECKLFCVNPLNRC
ncbi:MAG: type II-A CRISPR-associated protein Csn2 [Roseburia sp.]